MVNEFLVVTGSLCLIAALFEAWLLVIVISNPDVRLAKWIPGFQDVIKSHLDYLMMSLFLFIFYVLFNQFQIKPAAFIIACMCLGSFGNAFLFLVRAMKPSLKEEITVSFRLGMLISCLLTTIGYFSGAWLVARSAFALI
ncbi:MAG: hypothetical protein WCT07_03725 [Candidatus Paceibacterota bacterium]|jgi:hypothetical protein